MSNQARKRPRALTLTLPDNKQPFLVLEGQRYVLRNFNEDGIGLWMPNPPPFGLEKGVKLNGDIVIDNQIFGVGLETVHADHGILGLRIINKSLELIDLLRQLLEPTEYANDLQPTPGCYTEDARKGFPRLWYQARGQTELLVWYHPDLKNIQALQLKWLGQWVYREFQKSAQTGYLAEVSLGKNGTQAEPKDLLIAHKTPEAEMLQGAAQFLGAVPPPLPGYLLWQFLETGGQIVLPSSVFEKKKVA
jgi:hypothetical protein